MWKKVKALLKDNPKSVNDKDWSGQTPLHLAVEFDHKKLAELLLAHKADHVGRQRGE